MQLNQELELSKIIGKIKLRLQMSQRFPGAFESTTCEAETFPLEA